MFQRSKNTLLSVTVRLYTCVAFLACCASASAQSDTVTQWESLPILSYDSDAGFGYGVKSMLVNLLGHNESFDVTLFNSTNGERWYRAVISFPDPELRQGTVYPLSVDVTIDYDKWISNSFFGTGNDTKFSDREYYTREPLDLSVMAGRGITGSFIVQAGIRHRTVRNGNFSTGSRLRNTLPSLNAGTAIMNSIIGNARYDSRNSFIAPSSGFVLAGELEYAPIVLGSNTQITKMSGALQYYRRLIGSSVTAGRIIIQTLSGDNLPVQSLVSVGGTNTLRGIPQDRFLDRSSIVCNLEWRIPVLWRFGAVIGADAGRVARSLDNFSINNWSVNYVGGVRLIMDTFVVRMDIGISKETSGFYLNFGELF